MSYQHPEFLVSTEWLADNMDKQDIKVFDCTVFLRPDPTSTYRVESGLQDYLQGHIPGAGFLNLQDDFSDNSTKLRFTLPDPEHFANAAASAGISNADHVVLYSTTMPMWATRLWWMFRTFGHHKVSVLDGGFGKWKKEARAISKDEPTFETGNYQSVFNSERVADQDKVRHAVDNNSVCILNALSREQHIGEGPDYGRPGRISKSEAAPAMEMLDSGTGEFLSAEQLTELLGATGALASEKVITYCGGGIAASTTLFALALLGHEDRVSLYDASLSEWANLEDAPMESGHNV